MRIIVANEHYLLRDSLRMLLEMNNDHTVVAEPANEWQLMELLVEKSADVLLCDSEFPCKDFAKMLARVSDMQPNLELVLFTEAIKAKQLKQQFSSMVSVIIDKDNAGDEIIQTLKKLKTAKSTFTRQEGDKYDDNILRRS